MLGFDDGAVEFGRAVDPDAEAAHAGVDLEVDREEFAGGAGGGARQAAEVDHVRRTLEDRLKGQVESVDPRAAAALRDRITAAPSLLDALAPLVGLLRRGRDVHA